MKSQLIIRFHAFPINKSTVVEWLLIQPFKGIKQAGCTELSDLPKTKESTLIIVLIPSFSVASFQITLPKLRAGKIKKVAPFAVEEYLASDLSDVHTVISDSASDGKLRILGIAHEYIQNVLTELKLVGIQPDVVLPDFWYFPCEEKVWVIWIEREHAWVVTDSQEGFFSEIENLSILLTIRLNELKQNHQPLPEKILLVSEQDQTQLIELLKIQLSVSVSVVAQFPERSLLNIIADHLPAKQMVNLLQPPYVVKRKWAQYKQYWFSVLLLLILWLFLLLFESMVEYGYLKRQNKALEKQTLLLYQQILPARSHQAIKASLQHFLEKNLSAAQGNSFMKQLNRIASFIKMSQTSLLGFDYRNKIWILNVMAKDAQRLNEGLNVFKKQGISIEQKNIHQQGDCMIAEWVIKL